MSDDQFMNMGDEPTVSNETSMFPDFNVAFQKEMQTGVDETAAIPSQSENPPPVESDLVFVPVKEIDDSEVKDEDDPSELEAELNALIATHPIQQSIAAHQTVSAEQVVAFEQYYPNAITAKRNIRLFSVEQSVAGVQVACEGIGQSVVTGIKKVVEWIIRGFKRLIDMGLSLIYVQTSKADLGDLKTKYESALATAKKADSLRGLDAFKKRYGDTNAGKKSASCAHFVAIYTADHLSHQFNNRFLKGWRDIQMGTFAAETTLIIDQIIKGSGDIDRAMTALEQGGSVSTFQSTATIKDVPLTADGRVNADQLKQHVSQLNDTLKGTAKAYTTDPLKCIDVTNPFAGKMTQLEKCEQQLKAAESKIEALAKKDLKNPSDVKTTADSLKALNNHIQYCIALTKILKVYSNILISYHNAVGMSIHQAGKVANSL